MSVTASQDVNNPFLLQGITKRHIRLLQELHGDNAHWIYEVSYSVQMRAHIQECHVHSLWPRSQLLIPPRPPPSFSLAPLSPGHTPLLAAAWKFADEHTVSMVERQVRLGRVLGLFPPDNTNPAAWMQVPRSTWLGMSLYLSADLQLWLARNAVGGPGLQETGPGQLPGVPDGGAGGSGRSPALRPHRGRQHSVPDCDVKTRLHPGRASSVGDPQGRRQPRII